jgi:hypothetical protein
MDIYDQRLTLEDARIILQHALHERALCDFESFNDFYDVTHMLDWHDLYDYALQEALATSFVPNYSDHDRFLDAKYIKEVAMHTAALTKLNRALPVTIEHAIAARHTFYSLIIDGYTAARREQFDAVFNAACNVAQDMVINEVLRDYGVDTNLGG